MKKNRISKAIFLIAILAFSFASCNTERTREDKVSAIINKVDSPFLIVNAVPGNLIDKSGALDGALPFTQEMLLGFFIDEEVTGVDYDVNVQIIVAKGPSFAPNFYGIFKLKKEEAFITLMETEANAEVKEKDGYNYLIKESDQYVVVWDDEFAIASNIPMDFAAMMGGGGANQGMKAVDASIELIKAANDGDTNAEFKTFLDNKSDVAIHFDGDGFYAYMMEMSMGENEELEANRESIEGINTDIMINFNAGSIDVQALSQLSDKVKENMSFIGESAVNGNLFTYGNSANPMITMAYNTDLTKALDYAKEQMSEYDYQDLEEQAQNLGLTVEEAKSALTGEIVFVMDRVDIEEVEIDWGYGDPYISKQPIPYFGLVLGVADKSVMGKFLGESEDLGNGMVKNGDAYIVLTDDVLFSSNDSIWAAKVASNSSVKVVDKAGIFSSNPLAAFVDFETLSKMDDIDDIQVIIDMLVDGRMYGGMEEMNLSFTFKDASKNSLRILTETISNLTNEIENERDEAYEQLEAELEAAAADTEAEVEDALKELESALEEVEETLPN